MDKNKVKLLILSLSLGPLRIFVLNFLFLKFVNIFGNLKILAISTFPQSFPFGFFLNSVLLSFIAQFSFIANAATKLTKPEMLTFPCVVVL